MFYSAEAEAFTSFALPRQMPSNKEMPIQKP